MQHHKKCTTCISKGENLWFISHQPFSSFFLARWKTLGEKEGRRKGGRTDLRNATVVFFLFIYQTRANHRRHKFIGKAERLFRWNLQFICVWLEEVYIAEDDSFGGGGEIFSINGLLFDSSSGFKVHSRRNRAIKQASPKRQVCLLHARKGRLQREQSEKR